MKTKFGLLVFLAVVVSAVDFADAQYVQPTYDAGAMPVITPIPTTVPSSPFMLAAHPRGPRRRRGDPGVSNHTQTVRDIVENARDVGMPELVDRMKERAASQELSDQTLDIGSGHNNQNILLAKATGGARSPMLIPSLDPQYADVMVDLNPDRIVRGRAEDLGTPGVYDGRIFTLITLFHTFPGAVVPTENAPEGSFTAADYWRQLGGINRVTQAGSEMIGGFNTLAVAMNQQGMVMPDGTIVRWQMVIDEKHPTGNPHHWARVDEPPADAADTDPAPLSPMPPTTPGLDT